MDWWGIFLFIIQTAVVFVASTLVFDIIHYTLHYWRNSRFKIFRTFSAWHDVHHEFLDTNIKINKKLERNNFWYHLLPEFGSTVFGTLIFIIILPWQPVVVILTLHCVLFATRIYGKGTDVNHMDMDRLKGKRGVWFVSQSYHALHHIYPLQYYSSVMNIFDLIFATNCQIKGRKFLITGANGAYGKAMAKKITAMGGSVKTATHGADYSIDDYSKLDKKLTQTDVLILAHGTKNIDCMNANYKSFTTIIDKFIDIGKTRLVPPEVWAVGSEIEIHGSFGFESLKNYSESKQAYAKAAKKYFMSNDVMYKHIVPSAFTSVMGKGLMTAGFAVNYSLFFIRRGFNYIPVTYTGLAYLNYFKFRFLSQ